MRCICNGTQRSQKTSAAQHSHAFSQAARAFFHEESGSSDCGNSESIWLTVLMSNVSRADSKLGQTTSAPQLMAEGLEGPGAEKHSQFAKLLNPWWDLSHGTWLLGLRRSTPDSQRRALPLKIPKLHDDVESADMHPEAAL